MSKNRWMIAGGGIVALAGLAAPAFAAWDGLNMTKGVTDLSARIYRLHMEIFLVCVAIAVVVFGAMVYALVRYRKSRGAVADTVTSGSVAEANRTPSKAQAGPSDREVGQVGPRSPSSPIGWPLLTASPT